VPPRATAVLSASAETAPTQRDHHLPMTAERGRMAWQRASGYNLRAKVEVSVGRYKRVFSDAPPSRTDSTEATEVAIAAAALNRMLALGRPTMSVSLKQETGLGVMCPTQFHAPPSCNKVVRAPHALPHSQRP